MQVEVVVIVVAVVKIKFQVSTCKPTISLTDRY
jgi:hypothetical protein